MRREMHDMLARAAGDLQHKPFLRQDRPETIEDQVPVAGGGRGDEAGIGHQRIMAEKAA
jgi:hypothetical protein